MERDFPTIHPDLIQLAGEFEAFSGAEGLPDPVVTDLIRNPADQEAIYLKFYTGLQAALEPGDRHGMIDTQGDGEWRALTPTEWHEADQVHGLTNVQLRIRAKERFTWHWVKCAMDLRTRHYTRSQLVVAKSFFDKRCPKPSWEFLVHDVTAPHMHVGRRDAKWREHYMPTPTSPI